MSAAATSIMTLFSYIMSAQFRELYKEPVLLTLILVKTKLQTSIQTKQVLAWLLHYLIGFAFVLSFHLLWVNGFVDLSIINGFLLGSIIGTIGIIGWVFIFKIADYKPKIDFKGYYLQLFFAHVLFALTTIIAYRYLFSYFR